jgi:hypothetical protein
MKKLLVLLTGLMLVSSLGVAGADPDPDSMGFFFDTDATVYETSTVAPFQMVTGYIVVSNPTSTSVSGWECKIGITGSPVAPGWAYAGGGLNVFTPTLTDALFNVGVGLAPASLFPVNDVVVLATFSGFIMSPADVVTFTVLPFPGSVTFDNAPGYVDGNDVGMVVPCGVSSGFPYGAIGAIVNGTGVVDNADMTWGGVKALFN